MKGRMHGQDLLAHAAEKLALSRPGRWFRVRSRLHDICSFVAKLAAKLPPFLQIQTDYALNAFEYPASSITNTHNSST